MSKKKKNPQQKNRQNQYTKPASQLAKPAKTSKEKKRKEAQKRFVEKKKSSQTVSVIPKILSQYELEELKYEQKELVYEANRRIGQIKDAGYVSRAVDRVEHETGYEYFSLDNVETREDLIREVTRIRVFLNDDGSTIPGAKLETAQIYSEQYKGKFGNEYNNEENKFARYDIKSINGDVASRAFENYRKIESHRASQIIGDGAYGSENLIIALYDAEIRGLDSLIYGEELLDSYVLKESDEWESIKRDTMYMIPIGGHFEDNITGRYLF